MSACEIPPEMLDDDAQLKAKIAQQVTTASAASIHCFEAKSITKFGLTLEELSFDDEWTYYYTDEIPKHSKDRIILFRAAASSSRIGCIRVRHKDDMKQIVWDVVGKEGTYIGLVPAYCRTEAMLVDSRFMTVD